MLKNKLWYIAVVCCFVLLFSACSYKFGDAFSSDVSIEPSEEEGSSMPQQSTSEQQSEQSSEAEGESSSQQEEHSEEESEQSSESSTENESSMESESSSEAEQSQQSSDAGQSSAGESSSAAADGNVVGKTSKGYDIVEKDGITYIEGAVIVNKSYTLPEDYAPGFTGGTYKAFQIMQQDAAKQGIKLEIISGFRSYQTQQNTYNGWVNQYGKEYADTISARPGHSEHQSGLAMDVNSLKFAFADTKEGIWLAENCWKYGFIIRYPEGKEDITGYKYEPWHIRYLGKELAKKVYDSGLCLEEYFGITSEYK